MDYSERRLFCLHCAAGDYFAMFSDEADPGNRCGYADTELDDVARRLRERGLRLETDDRGIVVR